MVTKLVKFQAVCKKLPQPRFHLCFGHLKNTHTYFNSILCIYAIWDFQKERRAGPAYAGEIFGRQFCQERDKELIMQK